MEKKNQLDIQYNTMWMIVAKRSMCYMYDNADDEVVIRCDEKEEFETEAVKNKVWMNTKISNNFISFVTKKLNFQLNFERQLPSKCKIRFYAA